MVIPSRLRVAFFGTPEFALPSLDRLLASDHTVIGVVTQPDRPRGRGQRLAVMPVKARANAAGIPVLQPERLKSADFLKALETWHLDLGVVAAYGRILPDEVLVIPRLGMINVHASLLPRYRGAAPVHRAIIAGERETGVTIMRVVRALDAGPMLATLTRPIAIDETSEQLEGDLARRGAELVVEVAEAMAAGKLTEVSQDDALATYANRLTRADGLIDWSSSSVNIHNLVRGLHPWPHAYTYLDGRRLIVLKTETPGESGVTDTRVDRPGTILTATGEMLVVKTGDAQIRILELQAEGGRLMPVRDFLLGHSLSLGAVFTRP